MLDEILKEIRLALKGISAEVVDFVDYEEFEDMKPMIVLRVVSKEFKKVRPTIRCMIVDRTLHFKRPDLRDKYLFSFECFSPFEYKVLKLSKNTLQ